MKGGGSKSSSGGAGKPAHGIQHPTLKTTTKKNKAAARPKPTKDQPTNISASTCSWTRLGVRVSSADNKDVFLDHLRHALDAGCRLGVDFFAGTNDAAKLLEARNAAVLCVARDAPSGLHNHLVDAAHLLRVPVVVLPKLTLPLAATLGIKRASCFAVPTWADAARAAGKAPRARKNASASASPPSSVSASASAASAQASAPTTATPFETHAAPELVPGEVNAIVCDVSPWQRQGQDNGQEQGQGEEQGQEKEGEDDRQSILAHQAAAREAARDNVRDCLLQLSVA